MVAAAVVVVAAAAVVVVVVPGGGGGGARWWWWCFECVSCSCASGVRGTIQGTAKIMRKKS
jgi:hypothetical protein